MPARCQQSCALFGFAGAIPFLTRNLKPMGSGGSTVTRLKLKGVDAMTPQGVEYAAQFDSTRGMLPVQYNVRIDRLKALS